MNTTPSRKIADAALGAAIGATIAGPAGAVAGGIAASHASPHPVGATPDPLATTHAQDAASSPRHASPRRILVPVDFSPTSHQTIRFAREWASRFGAEVCLLHVIEPMNTVGGFGAEPIAAMLPPVDFHAQAKSALEKLAAQEFADGTRVSLHLRDGAPWDRIAVAAEELGADLIVISTHGRTGLSHALLGSNAERVVRHATVPVLTLRGAA